MRYLFLSCFLILFISGCSGSIPSNIGPIEGRLKECPKSPNCISSLAIDNKHFVMPLEYSGSKANAHNRLLLAINNIKGSKIVSESGNYIHAEFVSKVFRFTDDAEFLFDDKENKIHVRSASRKGYYDFGVNRKRIEQIRSYFER